MTLSLCQPNAWAVIYAGAANVHLRTGSNHRGRVLIHANDRWNEQCWEDWASYGVDVPSRECMEESGLFNVILGEAFVRYTEPTEMRGIPMHLFVLVDPVPYVRRHVHRATRDVFRLALPDDPAVLLGSAGDGPGVRL